MRNPKFVPFVDEAHRKEQAEEFLDELARLMPAGTSEQLALLVNPQASLGKEATAEERSDFNKAWRTQSWQKDRDLFPALNNFVSIGSLVKTANPKTGKLRLWRSKDAFAHGLAWYVDDIGAGRGSKGGLSIEDLYKILPPTAVVETSPDNFQVWYFLSKPVEDAGLFADFIRSMVDQFIAKHGGDQTVKDIVRIGRIPYGHNNKKLADGTLKYPDVNGKPWKVRLWDSDYRRRYTIQTIADKFGVTITRQQFKRQYYDKAELLEDAHMFDLAKIMLTKLDMGEAPGMPVTENQSGKCRIKCLWGHEHGNGDPTGAYIRGPLPGEAVPFLYHCAHDVCRERAKWANLYRGGMWQVFTDELIMPFLVGSLKRANLEQNTALFESVHFSDKTGG